MKTGDILFFAPGVTFDQADLNGAGFVRQFERRITGFYLEPADRCADEGFAFIVEEVRAAREAIARESDDNLEKIVEAARVRQSTGGREIVSLPPKKPESRERISALRAQPWAEGAG